MLRPGWELLEGWESFLVWGPQPLEPGEMSPSLFSSPVAWWESPVGPPLSLWCHSWWESLGLFLFGFLSSVSWGTAPLASFASPFSALEVQSSLVLVSLLVGLGGSSLLGHCGCFDRVPIVAAEMDRSCEVRVT